MLLGDRECALAQLERERQRLPRQRGGDRQVCEAPDLDEGLRDPARALERVLEVLARRVGTACPQLRDPEVHERERSVLRPHGQLGRPAVASSAASSPASPPRPWADRCACGRARGRRRPGTRRRAAAAPQVSRPRGAERYRGGLPLRRAGRAGWRRSRARRDVAVVQLGIRREHPEQRVQGLTAARHGQREVVVHEQPPRLRPVAGRLSVADGFDDIAVLLRARRPPCRAATGSLPARCAAARAAAGRRTGGGSGTTCGRRRAR